MPESVNHQKSAVQALRKQIQQWMYQKTGEAWQPPRQLASRTDAPFPLPWIQALEAIWQQTEQMLYGPDANPEWLAETEKAWQKLCRLHEEARSAAPPSS